MGIALRTSTVVPFDRKLVRKEATKPKTYTIEESFQMVEEILTAHYGVPIKSK